MIGYRQKQKSRRQTEVNNINLNEITPLASAPPVENQRTNFSPNQSTPQICPNLHKKLILTATNGYTWEDGCPISV